YKKVHRHEALTKNKEEGTSKSKGKGADPANWGNAGIPDEEQNLEAQAAELGHYQKLKKRGEEQPITKDYDKPDKTKPNEPQYKKARLSNRNDTPASERRSNTPALSMLAERRLKDLTKGRYGRKTTTTARRAEINPVEQVASKSYLGQALKNSRKAGRRRRTPSPSNSDPSSSSSSSERSSSSTSSDEDSSSSENDSSSEEDNSPVRQRNRSRKNRSRRRAKPTKSTLKPIPPKEYDGSPDARSYHRFVTEGTAYLQDGKVKPRRQAFILSYYLKDKAYDFYTQRVSMNASEWGLEDFLRELFNYCFPINYRLKQREKLKRSFQNDKSVTEFCFELEELYMMIGISDEREKVIKLWHSLRPGIQKALWRERLNPEVSTWEEVSEAAQIIEISEGVMDPREGRSQARKAGNSRRDNQSPNRTRKSHNRRHAFERRNHRFQNKNYEPKPDRDHQRSGERTTPRTAPRSSEKRDRGPEKPSLSEKERNELLAAGKCFRCKETGHVARQCPKGTFVRSDKSGKPPGVPSFGIDLALDEAELFQELASTTETLYGVGVGAISFDLETHPQLKCLRHKRRDLGNSLEMIALRQLQAGQPYPGDQSDEPMDLRFCVIQVRDDLVVIEDECLREEPIYIERKLLLDQEFNLPLWFAMKRADYLGLDINQIPVIDWIDYKMGDVWAHGLIWALHDNTDLMPRARYQTPEGKRFAVIEKDDVAYQIIDYGEHLISRISTDMTKNPKLRIAEWYTKRVVKAREQQGLLHAEPIVEPPPPLHNGSILGAFARKHLEAAAPYPLDPRSSDMPLDQRFKVFKVSERSHIITDELAGADTIVPTSYLEDPEFRLAKWYSQKRLDSLPRHSRMRWHISSRIRNARMGNAYCEAAEEILEQCGPFPGDEDYVRLGGRWQ
ncbi:hypothetical protein H0H92_007833, partial [Tricholoma furcatifolium]